MGKHKNPASKKDKKKKKDKSNLEDDAEVAGQVKEIEERLQEISGEMNNIDAKQRRYAIESRRAELTNRELDRLADDTKIYRQVGRMWIKQPKVTLVQNLKAMQGLKAVEGQQMRQMRLKLEERARSEADGLKELVGENRFKDILSKAGETKPDPSKVLFDMTDKKDDDGMKPALSSVSLAVTSECKGRLPKMAPVFKESPTLTMVVSSVIASFFGTVASQPFDVVKSRIQNMKIPTDGSPAPYSGAVDCATKCLKDGPLTLMRGFFPAFVKLTPYTVISLTLVEKLTVLLTGKSAL